MIFVCLFYFNTKPFSWLVFMMNKYSIFRVFSLSPTHSLPSPHPLVFFLMAEVNSFETFIWTWMRKTQWQEQKLKFHYLLCPSLGTQLVSALCGPGIFTALASPSFIVVFLSSHLADSDVITCSLPLAVWDTVDNYTISESPTCGLEDGRRWYIMQWLHFKTLVGEMQSFHPIEGNL